MSDQIPDAKQIEHFDIRYTELEDGKYLKKWLMDRKIGMWFPMNDEIEIDDAVQRWIGFYRFKASLTATIKGEPCGIATLYLQPYKKIAHQCEFGIIVDPEHRGKGVGTNLLRNIIHLGKTYFKIELLHLTVYEGNPAIRLYSRFGFNVFGHQKHWIKEEEGYNGRLFMEKYLSDKESMQRVEES